MMYQRRAKQEHWARVMEQSRRADQSVGPVVQDSLEIRPPTALRGAKGRLLAKLETITENRAKKSELATCAQPVTHAMGATC